jgi:hypothetical protein
VSARLGIDEYHGEGRDGGRRHQRRPALAQAGAGVATGTGTDVATINAPVTLVKGDLRGIVQA